MRWAHRVRRKPLPTHRDFTSSARPAARHLHNQGRVLQGNHTAIPHRLWEDRWAVAFISLPIPTDTRMRAFVWQSKRFTAMRRRVREPTIALKPIVRMSSLWCRQGVTERRQSRRTNDRGRAFRAAVLSRHSCVVQGGCPDCNRRPAPRRNRCSCWRIGPAH